MAIILKKFALIFSVFLIIAINSNFISASAITNKTFSEGIYSIKDLNLLPNVTYKVQNVSGGKSFISILNSDLVLEQSIRLESQSLQYLLIPMQFDYKIVLIGSGNLSFL